MKGLLELANALADSQGKRERGEVYSHMQALEQQVHAAQQALSLALDSARLNPWARSTRRLIIDYPNVLLALDRLARQMHRIAYTIDLFYSPKDLAILDTLLSLLVRTTTKRARTTSAT